MHLRMIRPVAFCAFDMKLLVIALLFCVTYEGSGQGRFGLPTVRRVPDQSHQSQAVDPPQPQADEERTEGTEPTFLDILDEDNDYSPDDLDEGAPPSSFQNTVPPVYPEPITEIVHLPGAERDEPHLPGTLYHLFPVLLLLLTANGLMLVKLCLLLHQIRSLKRALSSLQRDEDRLELITLRHA